MAEQKQYKWQVKPGGSGAMDQQTANAMKQANSTSLVGSLGINKGGDTAPTLDAQSATIAHALNVPDSKHQDLNFQKGDGTSSVGADSSVIAHALNAPKPPRHIGAIDKTQAVTGQPGLQ